MKLLEKSIYNLFALSVKCLLESKESINGIVALFLVFITATETNSKSDIPFTICSLVIIIGLYLERKIMERSRYFRIFRSIETFNNSTAPFRPIIHYNRYRHVITMSSVVFLEFIKLSCAIYLMITLGMYPKVPKRILLIIIVSFTLIESALGIILYLPGMLGLLFVKNAFVKFLDVIRSWYHDGVIESKVWKENHNIIITACPLNDSSDIV